MNLPRYFALIPAACVGSRMGAGHPKQYLNIAGKPMLRHVLDIFAASPAIHHVFVVVSAGDAYIEQLCAAAPSLKDRVSALCVGGVLWFVSVFFGLCVLCVLFVVLVCVLVFVVVF